VPQVDVGLIISAVNNASPGLKTVGTDVKKIGENAQAAANHLKAIQVVIAGIAVEQIRRLSEMFLKAAAATQSLDLHLAAFAGGVGPASAIWSKLNSEFGATPFKIEGITSAWIKLQAVTGNSAESTKIIEAVVNAVAAMPDGSDEKINDITVALQRMLATGVVNGRQFKAIISDTGLTVGDLAKAAGKGTQEFTRTMDDGFMNAQSLIDAFIKASHDKFGDFAIKLGSTLGGAMNKIENDFRGALSRLGERTDINDRLTQVFQNLDKAVMSFIDHINQGNIDAFFNVLSNMEPIVTALVIDVKNIAMLILGVGNATAFLLDMLPSEATEYGIIGYILGGKKGALIGTVIGLIDWAWRGVIADIAQGLSWIGVLSDENYVKMRKWADHSTLEDLAALAGSGDLGQNSGIFAKNAAMSAQIKKDLGGIANTKPNVTPVTGDTDKLVKALEAAARAGDAIGNALAKANDDIAQMNAQTSGDELGANLEGINKKTDGWIASLDQAIDKEKALEVHTGANAMLIEMAKEQIDAANEARDRAIDKEQQLFALKTKSFLLDTKLTEFGIADQFAKMQNQFNTSSGFNVLGGTAGGAAHLQLMQTEFDLRTQIKTISKAQLDIDQQIFALSKSSNPLDQEKVEALEHLKGVYQQLGDLAQTSLKNLTIEGTLAKQMWTEVGNTLHNDAAEGIKGLITGTMTLGQIATKVWSDITDSVIQYLLKLAEAKAMESAMSALGGSTGGFSIGSLFGAANGAAFKGHITPFANGGITQGPTMFGLMGEAGTEAVMPLTRIGGKLGVRSEGGGGNHYHITLQAIDTQTGMEFLSKHIDNIDGQIGQRQTLHRGRRAAL
jgi:tape measure domain-containing protein